MPYQKSSIRLNTILVVLGVILPFIFLKDVYPFHRFGMFAESVKYEAQSERFYILYKKDNDNKLTLLEAQNIPLNANAFHMQIRKYHYQDRHSDFIRVFDEIIKNKSKTNQKIEWKWYHVRENSQNEIDSVCVFSN